MLSLMRMLRNHVVQQTSLKTNHLKDQCDIVPEVGKAPAGATQPLQSAAFRYQGSANGIFSVPF